MIYIIICDRNSENARRSLHTSCVQRLGAGLLKFPSESEKAVRRKRQLSGDSHRAEEKCTAAPAGVTGIRERV